MTPEESLANAIIRMAAWDYSKALKGKTKEDRIERESLENFFRSQWFEVLSDADGEYIMRRIKETPHLPRKIFRAPTQPDVA